MLNNNKVAEILTRNNMKGLGNIISSLVELSFICVK